MVTAPTIVLVHGAGHTAPAWDRTRTHLRCASIAVDLPGRRNRPAHIAGVTIDAAADSICADVDAVISGEVVLVGHSAGGILLPAVAARLGARVQHLVFVAGLCARHGERVIDTVRPDHAAEVAVRADDLARRYHGHMLAPDDHESWIAIDQKVAASVDSLTFLLQVVSWDGVSPALPRTFVRPLRDRIQPREMQARLIENCAASQVIDIDTGHTPALAAPERLAAILDEIAETSAGVVGRRYDSSAGTS